VARQIEDAIAFDFSPVELVIAIGSRGKITLSWLEASKELSLPVPGCNSACRDRNANE